MSDVHSSERVGESPEAADVALKRVEQIIRTRMDAVREQNRGRRKGSMSEAGAFVHLYLAALLDDVIALGNGKQT